MTGFRRTALMAGLLALGFSATVALAQEKTLRISMTAADIPRTLGQPDQCFEGNRFTGIPIYDGLTHWDLSKEKVGSVAAMAAPAYLRAQSAPVKVGILQPMTGALAFDGQQGRLGAELALKAISDAGGIKAMGGAKIRSLGRAEARRAGRKIGPPKPSASRATA